MRGSNSVQGRSTVETLRKVYWCSNDYQEVTSAMYKDGFLKDYKATAALRHLTDSCRGGDGTALPSSLSHS